MPESVASTVSHIRNELSKVIVGQDDAIEHILIALLAEGHALVEGVPGTAKTLMVKTLSRIDQCHLYRIQFTPDLMPFISRHQRLNIAPPISIYGAARFYRPPPADEINARHQNAGGALEAMEEAGDDRRRCISATSIFTGWDLKPIEYEGTILA